VKVIVTASRKGGVGKSTLTANLAVAAGLSKHAKAAIIDLDPQGSLVHWREIRQADGPIVQVSTPKKLKTDLATLAKAGITHVLIDMPPYDKEWVSDIMRMADLIVVPTKASPLDLHSVSATLDSLRQAEKPMIWIINSASSRARNIADTVAKELVRFAPVCPQKIHERTDFVLAMGEGKSVVETKPKGPSAKEILAAWKFVASKL
jgi:chromosome partitioning protein